MGYRFAKVFGPTDSVASVVAGGRKKRRGGGKSISRTAFKWIRIGALVAPAAIDIMKEDTLENKVGMVLKHYTGFDIWQRQFYLSDLIAGWGPYVAACLATYGVPKIASIIRRL